MVENKIIFETENVFRSKLCKSNSNSAWNKLAFPVFTLTLVFVWNICVKSFIMNQYLPKRALHNSQEYY